MNGDARALDVGAVAALVVERVKRERRIVAEIQVLADSSAVMGVAGQCVTKLL